MKFVKYGLIIAAVVIGGLLAINHYENTRVRTTEVSLEVSGTSIGDTKFEWSRNSDKVTQTYGDGEVRVITKDKAQGIIDTYRNAADKNDNDAIEVSIKEK